MCEMGYLASKKKFGEKAYPKNQKRKKKEGKDYKKKREKCLPEKTKKGCSKY